MRRRPAARPWSWLPTWRRPTWRGVALALDRPDAAATEELETAIRLDPRLFEAYYFHARTLLAQGRLEDAAAAFEQASRVRPEDYQAAALVIGVYRGLGRMSEAESAARRALDMIERHLELNPDDARAWNMAAAGWCFLGDRERALDWTTRALRLDPADPVICYNAACTYALLGQPEPALESLERAVEKGFVHREWMEHDADLDGLRGHPRFEALIAQCQRGRTS